jgi:hypothetical protein
MGCCRVQSLLYLLVLLGLCTCTADRAHSSVLVVFQPGACIPSSEGTFIQYQATFYNRTGEPYSLIPATKPVRLYSTLSIRVDLPQQGPHTFPLYFPSYIKYLTIPPNGHFTLPLQLLSQDLRQVPYDSICQVLQHPFTGHAQDPVIRFQTFRDFRPQGR